MLDVELAPNLGTFWSIWQQNIGINQLLETSRVMCFSAKWFGKKEMIFDSEHMSEHVDMVAHLHRLLSEADAICHYNGDRFDLPVINREFLLYSMPPPDTYKSIDLLKIIKRRFRFVSNKLDHVVQELGLGKKAKHEGHELWLKCMAGDKAAWKRMETYNKMDVVLLEKLYNRILPWIDTHPNHNLFETTGELVCPNCGGKHLVKKGVEHLKTRSYQRYRCKTCLTPIRGTVCIPATSVQLTQAIGA